MGLQGVIIGLVIIIVIYLVVGVGGGYACRDADKWIQTTQTPWDKTWFKDSTIPTQSKLSNYKFNRWPTKGDPSSVCKIFNNGSPYNPLKWINPYSYCNEQRLATCQQNNDADCGLDWQTPDNSWCKPQAWYLNNADGDADGDGGAATCTEAATTSVPADAAACAAVTGTDLDDATACDAVMTTADGGVAACTYEAANAAGSAA